MGKRKTHEEFVKEVFKLVGNEYTVLGTYIDADTKILMRHNCEKCNSHEYMVIPSKFTSANRRCPKCNGKFKKTTNQFKKEVYNLVGNEYEVLGEYINNRTKIKIKHNCNKCHNYIFDMTPNDFLNCGHRCPKCNGGIKKKTTDIFKQEVYNLVGNEYTILGEYVNYNTKLLIKHNCDECNNYEYMVSPDGFLQGRRCPKCAWKTTNRQPRKIRTTESFIKEVNELLDGEYTVLGEYQNMHSPILIQHNKCNYKRYITPSAFLRHPKCPICDKHVELNSEDYINKIHYLYNGEYEVLSPYIDIKTPVIFLHNTCGCIFEKVPDFMKETALCPVCTNARITNMNQLKLKFNILIDNEYTILTNDFISMKDKIKIRHNCISCNNHEFYMSPTSFLSGQRCPKCFGNELKTHEQFVEDLHTLYGEEYSAIGTYVNAHTKIEIQHNICNKHFFVPPNSILSGHQCPFCQNSKGEKRVERYLHINKINYILHKTFDDLLGLGNGKLSYDFYLNNNICIEYDGEQHFQPVDFANKGQEWANDNFKKQKKHDKLKNEYCINHKILLIRIPYWDFNNIEEILDNVLIYNDLNSGYIVK